MDNFARLRWKCRRGSKELDLLLMRYLETRYLAADKVEQARFAAILELDDEDVMRLARIEGFFDADVQK